MLEAYTPLLLYAGLLVLVAGGVLALTILLPIVLGTRRSNPTKLEPYECGVPSLQEGARGRYTIQFYLIAILFILFDVEMVFLIPWAAEYKLLGVGALVEVLVFIGILVVGYVYVWKRGALEWD
jgi:NADH-quinone oxidoreductase subunit A